MALKMAIIDATGTEHLEAYWRPVQVNLGIADENVHVIFYGYKDQDARLAKKQPLPGAVRTYTISGQEFRDLFAAHMAPGGPNIAQMVYAYAKAKKDVKSPTPEDPNRMVGFFDNAEDVL